MARTPNRLLVTAVLAVASYSLTQLFVAPSSAQLKKLYLDN